MVLLTVPAVLAVLYLMFRKELSRSKDAEETIGALAWQPASAILSCSGSR